MRLDGLSLDGGGGGGGAAVTATAASTVTQNGLALVTLGVTAGGGDGSYVYAWTLTDPLGVDRSVLLSSSTIAAPTFTPTLLGGAWTAVCVVTDGQGETARAIQQAVIGQSGFVLARSIVSDGTTDASVSGGNIAWGGVTFAAPNAGVSVEDGDLRFDVTGSVDLGRTSTSTRNAPLVTVSLAGLCGLTILGDRQILMIVAVESFVPAVTAEALRIGLEQASAPIGSGAGGRGVAGGPALAAGTIRVASTLNHEDTSSSAVVVTATTATVAGIGLLFACGGITQYARTTAFTDAADVLDETFVSQGGARASATVPTLNQAVLAMTRPSAGTNSAVIEGLQVWVR